MTARDVIRQLIEPQAWAALIGRDTLAYRNRRTSSERKADTIIKALTAAGYRIVGPDDVKLIETALSHASFALDGVVALDDEDMGNDGGSDTCQHAKKTVDRALALLRSLSKGERG